MSDFHKQKAEARKSKKLVFSAESLETWKQQQMELIEEKVRKEVTDELAKMIEDANNRLDERQKFIEENEHKIKLEACTDAFLLLIGIPLKILYDKYGWRSRKKLPEFGEYVCDYYQEFAESGLSAEEYRKFITDVVGLGFMLNEEREEENERNYSSGQ